MWQSWTGSAICESAQPRSAGWAEGQKGFRSNAIGRQTMHVLTCGDGTVERAGDRIILRGQVVEVVSCDCCVSHGCLVLLRSRCTCIGLVQRPELIPELSHGVRCSSVNVSAHQDLDHKGLVLSTIGKHLRTRSCIISAHTTNAHIERFLREP